MSVKCAFSSILKANYARWDCNISTTKDQKHGSDVDPLKAATVLARTAMTSDVKPETLEAQIRAEIAN
ncbi:MAG TPA: hypothetical protein VGK99_09415 [Acidobacteriota bacterium]